MNPLYVYKRATITNTCPFVCIVSMLLCALVNVCVCVCVVSSYSPPHTNPRDHPFVIDDAICQNSDFSEGRGLGICDRLGT